MRNTCLWCEELAPIQIQDQITLDRAESHHLITVLRAQEGMLLTLLDGKGWSCDAQYLGKEKKQARVQVLDKTHRERSAELTLVGPIPKGKRVQTLLEKVQEIGVSRWIPLKSRYSLDERSTKEKWIATLREACKQSRNPWLVEIGEVTTLEELDPKRACVMDQSGKYLSGVKEFSRDILIYGPEGGWSDDEREWFRKHELSLLKVSENILRMESAAIVGAARVLEALESGKR